MGKGKPRRWSERTEPLELKWYDRVISNLIRMRTQGDNITKVCIFDHEIVIKRNGKGVDIYGDEAGLFESGYEPVALTFPTLQEAIEFDYKTYDENRAFYFS